MIVQSDAVVGLILFILLGIAPYFIAFYLNKRDGLI